MYFRIKCFWLDLKKNWMNEWMHEWMTDWLNEWINEQNSTQNHTRKFVSKALLKRSSAFHKAHLRQGKLSGNYHTIKEDKKHPSISDILNIRRKVQKYMTCTSITFTMYCGSCGTKGITEIHCMSLFKKTTRWSSHIDIPFHQSLL